MKSDEKKPGRRSRAVAAKRAAILEAALTFFSQFGIHGTSLDKVAERAEVSKTNLLYYYPSKEVLYVAVLKEILDVWLAPLRALDRVRWELERPLNKLWPRRRPDSLPDVDVALFEQLSSGGEFRPTASRAESP